MSSHNSSTIVSADSSHDFTTNAQLSDNFMILARKQTEREDPLRDFNVYTGGWDTRNRHYWASVGYTAHPGLVLAILWLMLGLLFVFILMFCCCFNIFKGSHSGDVCLPLLFLLLFTGITMSGSILVYVYQGKANDEIKATLRYAVGESANVVTRLQDTSSYANLSTSLHPITYFVPQSEEMGMAKLAPTLADDASTLQTKMHKVEQYIRQALDLVRSIIEVTAGVMLLLSLLGFLFSTLGMMPLLYLLIMVVWFLVAATWILCGVFIMFDHVVDDACVAMEDWTANPSAHTVLDEYLPCGNTIIINSPVDQMTQIVNDTINGINKGIETHVNNASTSSQIPLLCNPSLLMLASLSPPAPRASDCVNISNAAQAWLPYVCSNHSSSSTSTNDTCKLTKQTFDHLNQSIYVINTLYNNIPFLVDVENCVFVRNIFTTIRYHRCPQLHNYFQRQYIGLALISGGFMFSILLWIIFSKKRRHLFHHKNSTLSDSNSYD